MVMNVAYGKRSITLLISSCMVLIVACQSDPPLNLPLEIDSPQIFNTYDAAEEYPFGRLNPEAPEDTSQFGFMIGNFNCSDSLLTQGQWKASKATWNSAFILNGHAVKDTYRNEDFAGTSIRFYNSKKKKWDVYFFGMPGGHTGLWEGEQEGNQMIMRQLRKGPNGEQIESRLTFYNIRDNSFDWKGEFWNLESDEVTVNWKIKATRAQ